MCFVGQHKSLGQLGGGWPSCQKEAWTHELCLSIHQRPWVINSIRVIVCEFFLCDLCGSYFTERKFCWNVPVRTAPCISYILFLAVLFCCQLFSVILRIGALRFSHRPGEVARRCPMDRHTPWEHLRSPHWCRPRLFETSRRWDPCVDHCNHN